jgi:hypothetical protein
MTSRTLLHRRLLLSLNNALIELVPSATVVIHNFVSNNENILQQIDVACAN